MQDYIVSNQDIDEFVNDQVDSWDLDSLSSFTVDTLYEHYIKMNRNQLMEEMNDYYSNYSSEPETLIKSITDEDINQYANDVTEGWGVSDFASYVSDTLYRDFTAMSKDKLLNEMVEYYGEDWLRRKKLEAFK